MFFVFFWRFSKVSNIFYFKTFPANFRYAFKKIEVLSLPRTSKHNKNLMTTETTTRSIAQNRYWKAKFFLNVFFSVIWESFFDFF